jgi:hypothetical protein
MSNIVQLPTAEPQQGMLDIYRAGCGMRGIDAMLPIELAKQVVDLIKAAGVPVRHEAPEGSAYISLLRP